MESGEDHYAIASQSSYVRAAPLGFTSLDTNFNCVRALVFMAFMLSISALLTKMKLRLQL